MASNYPTSLDVESGVGGSATPVPDTTDATNSPSHADLHQNLGDGLIAAQTKIGTGSATPTAGTVLAGDGSGTSAWKTEDAIGRVPVGALVPYAGTATPDANYWLLCDGAAVSRTTYATLFALVSTTFGVGDGSTTFNVPDMRGRVPMALDNLGGSSANTVTDASADTLGGTVGDEDHTLTESEIPSHTHSFSDTSTSAGGHSHDIDHNHGSVTSGSGGAHNHDPQTGANGFLTTGSGSQAIGDATAFTSTGATSATTDTAAAHTHSVDLPNYTGTSSSEGAHTHDVSGTTGSAGSGSAHNIVQPSMALGYLIRAA